MSSQHTFKVHGVSPSRRPYDFPQQDSSHQPPISPSSASIHSARSFVSEFPAVAPYEPGAERKPFTMTSKAFLGGPADPDDGYDLVFSNLEEFQQWRLKEEEEKSIEFVKSDSHGSKAVPPRFKDHTKLVCARHPRTGRKKYVKKHPERQRKVPSRKIDGEGCPASISYKTYYNTPIVRAMYASNHSHDIGPANLPFTRRGRKAAAEEEERKRAEANANNGYRTLHTLNTATDISGSTNTFGSTAVLSSSEVKQSPEASPTVSTSTTSPVVQHGGYSANQHYFTDTSAYHEPAPPDSPLEAQESLSDAAQFVHNYTQSTQRSGFSSTSPHMSSNNTTYSVGITYPTEFQHYQQPMASLSPPAIQHQSHTPESPDTQPLPHSTALVGQGVPESEGHVSYVDGPPDTTSPQGSPYQEHPFGPIHARQYSPRPNNEDRWNKLTALFQTVRSRAGWGYSYAESSVTGLEDVLTRLAYENSPPQPAASPSTSPLFGVPAYYPSPNPHSYTQYPSVNPHVESSESPVAATLVDGYNTGWSEYPRRPVVYATLAGAVDEPRAKPAAG